MSEIWIENVFDSIGFILWVLLIKNLSRKSAFIDRMFDIDGILKRVFFQNS